MVWPAVRAVEEEEEEAMAGVLGEEEEPGRALSCMPSMLAREAAVSRDWEEELPPAIVAGALLELTPASWHCSA